MNEPRGILADAPRALRTILWIAYGLTLALSRFMPHEDAARRSSWIVSRGIVYGLAALLVFGMIWGLTR